MASETQSARKKSPPPPRLCPVVGMGASAGGLEAFQKFFSRMPADSGMAFVLAQHLDPRHETLMPELLGRTTAMRVEQARDGTPVQPNHVYVIPPNAVLTIEGGVLRVKPPPEREGLRMNIDSLFHSLARDQGTNAVGILLSGSGSDGTLGLRSVKEHGGMVMAQTPESAKHDAMPLSAISTGMVDHAMRPEDMPSKLLEYAAYLQGRKGAAPILEEASAHLGPVAALLRQKTGHDFSRYKPGTVVRRIQRRMQVHQVPTVAAYVERLGQDPKEVDLLFHDLLIGVTHFFRDPEAFELLARDVVPRIVEHAGHDGPIRVWTPGCATGEEAYSLAMLLKEEMARRPALGRVQIFAGDIDDEALEFARQGRYPQGIVEHLTPERLARFFVKDGHSYQIAKDIREMMVFSNHNLIRDPPFSRLDLIVCRNLLIYLEADVQRNVASLFHYALRTDGFLFLGSSENLACPPDLFRTVDKKHRLFQRKDSVARPPLPLPAREPGTGRTGGTAARPWSPRPPASGQGEFVAALERLLLDHYAPAWVIVNATGEVVYFSPRTGRYLEPAPGTPSMDLVGMARKGLRLDLRTALHTAVKGGEAVVREGVQVETHGVVQRINLVVRPLAEVGGDAGLYLVVFQELGPPRAREEGEDEGAATPDGDPIVQQLESELRTTREHLQATVEEVESSNEELKSSNEELLSTNEELQSANEELQTSKEEMQSVNEELETVNAELGKKVEELDLVNSDLQNLLHSTQIPTLFLDDALHIKRFTAAATALFRLIPSDAGRPIADIASRFDADVIEDLGQALRTRSVRERRVRLADGSATYLMRMLPYRRADGAMDGLVVAFVDVTQLEQALAHKARLAAIVESSQDAIVGRTFDGTITSWNQAASHLLGYTQEEALGRVLPLIVPSDRREEMREPYERFERGEVVAPFESERTTKDGRRIVVSVAISPLKDEGGRLIGASGIFRDITELKRAQEALREEARNKDQFLSQLSHELRNPLAPLRSCLDVLRMPGRTEAEAASCLGIMDRQLRHLTRLVEQLLDASRISSGKIHLDQEDFDLAELVRAAVDDHRSLLDAAGLRLHLSLPDRKLWVRGDWLRLTQVVANLLVNAGKFTDRGGDVELELRPEEDGARALLRVRDTGIGIGADVLERLFRPFSQAPHAVGRLSSGLGLGLALVRALVESHGGTVEARSEGEGRGAEIRVRLPLTPAPTLRAPVAEAGPDSPGPSRRILVVEDEPETAEGMRLLLAQAGNDVALAGDGEAALARAREMQPEIVFCDIRLPGTMDGYAIATELRRDPGYGSPYLVALTGYGQSTDQARALSAGFHYHLTKPADSRLIQRLLAQMPRRS